MNDEYGCIEPTKTYDTVQPSFCIKNQRRYCCTEQHLSFYHRQIFNFSRTVYIYSSTQHTKHHTKISTPPAKKNNKANHTTNTHTHTHTSSVRYNSTRAVTTNTLKRRTHFPRPPPHPLLPPFFDQGCSGLVRITSFDQRLLLCYQPKTIVVALPTNQQLVVALLPANHQQHEQ